MPYDYLHIAVIQTDLIWENAKANRTRFEKLFLQLPNGTELVILPEMFSTGFSMNVNQLGEPMNGKTICWLKDQAAAHGTVIAGSLMIREDGECFNRFVFVYPDQTLDFYDKRHLFSMGQEQMYFVPGLHRKIVQIKSFRILPQICYDLRFPVFSRNRNDYDLMINCANWPGSRSDVWKTLLKARAIENQAYVIGVNRIGIDANKINYKGDSMVIDPKGKEMVTATEKEEILPAKLSKESLDQFREKFPVLPDADNFSLCL
ncbi:MAG: amidohydrolase [Prolixibacteraceae bacterium]